MDETPARNVGVRLPPELAKRLDVEIERLKSEHPGAGWTQAGVLRMALERYLRTVAAAAASAA